jgi:hypothetical protein
VNDDGDDDGDDDDLLSCETLLSCHTMFTNKPHKSSEYLIVVS